MKLDSNLDIFRSCERFRKCTQPAFWLAAYLVLMNLVTFWVYGADKRRARRGRWRVPERTLFLLPLLGGGIGALAGMRVFHHKTKHWYFVWGVPAILLAQLALAVWLLPLGHSRHFPSPTGCLRRRMVPEQVIYPPFSPAGRCVLQIRSALQIFPY